MLDDGGCKIAPPPSPSGGGAEVVDPRRPAGDIVITSSVGSGGVNRSEDVWNIQYGLNQVPIIDGGPTTPLTLDGLCGPNTIGAIRNFQVKHFGWGGCDGRIDPGQQTLAKLNEKRQRWIVPKLPVSMTTDGWLLADILAHVPHTRACVHAAMVMLNSAKYGGLGERANTLTNRHFQIDGLGSGRDAGITYAYNVYRNMLSVLDRPDAYCTLDTTDAGASGSTIAYARLGGFFDKSDLTGKIVFGRGAYFASGIQDFAAHVFLHELRHYVEQQGDECHYGIGWYTDPAMIVVTPEQRLSNADTYGNFALEARNGDMDRPGWLRYSQKR
jgi:hypothetical protein